MDTNYSRKIPVTSNQYFSNTVSFNLRSPPVPNTVPYQYKGTDRINNFQTNVVDRRQISDTYRASDRNYSHPARTSPVMMTTGVHPKDL